MYFLFLTGSLVLPARKQQINVCLLNHLSDLSRYGSISRSCSRTKLEELLPGSSTRFICLGKIMQYGGQTRMVVFIHPAGLRDVPDMFQSHRRICVSAQCKPIKICFVTRIGYIRVTLSATTKYMGQWTPPDSIRVVLKNINNSLRENYSSDE